MDIVSHAILGRVLVEANTKPSVKGLTVFFSIFPDLFQIPLYIFLGYINHRPFFYPLPSDWEGVRNLYPGWILLWEIPHSLFFLLLAIVPLIYLLKLPKIAVMGYFFHIFVDLFTHTGEWGVKPFFPFNFQVEGFTDAWAWDFYLFPIAWVTLLLAVYVIDRLRKRIGIKQLVNG